jgi:hypothetical protein
MWLVTTTAFVVTTNYETSTCACVMGSYWDGDDLNALRQAVTLFISDTLRKTPTKPKRPDAQPRA